MTFSKIKIQAVKEKNYSYNSRKINSRTEIVKLINELEDFDKNCEEITILICLNNKLQIVGYTEIARGSVNGCFVDLKSIFKFALCCNSNKLILAHNHPTGDVVASKEDFELTERVKKACEIMDFQLLDHVIIGDNNNFGNCMVF